MDKILNYIICFINKSQLYEYVDLILYREVFVTLQHVCQSHQTLNMVHVRVETTRLHCSQSGLMGEAKGAFFMSPHSARRGLVWALHYTIQISFINPSFYSNRQKNLGLVILILMSNYSVMNELI